ncbi:hypothetical protein LB515_07615 [Mesorhizobium sp. CA15]|uniref:hypothetical protein n=1 Tax=Mesorhizobium sp. CA15 TaxID=2876641 RepID=UPI001CD166E7|nr:hypothetical protein [Mesorhizobium sp. CA15]MBZ9865236.1 hypothetical protein [Mesorhizobium sp. CA15]
MSTKHLKSRKLSDADLENNPGIGTSKGSIKEGDDLELGENTTEGDVENDTTASGGINPRQKMRTNK